MKNKMFVVIASIIAQLWFLSGCAVEPVAARKLTFPEAMRSLRDGLDVLREPLKPGQKPLGLVPTEVTAVFNMTTTANGELGVNLSGSPVTGITTSISGSSKQTIQRGNTVTVKLTNVYVDKEGKLRPISSEQPPVQILSPMVSPNE